MRFETYKCAGVSFLCPVAFASLTVASKMLCMNNSNDLARDDKEEIVNSSAIHDKNHRHPAKTFVLLTNNDRSSLCNFAYVLVSLHDLFDPRNWEFANVRFPAHL